MAKYTPKVYELDANQVAAMNLLLAGRTTIDVAAELGLSRETISRWRNHDATFIAEWNAALHALRAETEAAVVVAKVKAIARLASMVDSQNPELALKAAATLAKLDTPKVSAEVLPEQVERRLALRF